jgi:hypothetical protein
MDLDDLDLIDTSTTAGQREWSRLCSRAMENLPLGTAATFDDVDAILTWALPYYEEITAGRRRTPEAPS